MDLPPFEYFPVTILVIFFAIGLHEYAHCKFADMAGDPTPGSYGRVTLNLTKHFEPLGTMMMVITSLTGVGIGWGKPAPINPSKMNNPRWDAFISVAAGPLSNLAQAVVYAVILRAALATGGFYINDVYHTLERQQTNIVACLLTQGVIINLSLAMFNMIPLGPLDGHWLVGLLLPEKLRVEWFRFFRSGGQFIIIAVILMSQLSGFPFLSIVLGKPVFALFRILTGVHI